MSAAVLADLATLINTEHSAAQSAYGSALEHALRVGELLTQAKTQCAHGAWLPWLSENCPEIAERTAQAYMRLHRERDRLPKSATVADLTVRGSLEFLVDPPPAPEAAQEQHEPDVGSGDALDRVQAGICDDADADKALLRAGDIAAASRCAARIRKG